MPRGDNAGAVGASFSYGRTSNAPRPITALGSTAGQRCLSCYRYNGCNNGMIGLGCRELADALNCSRDTAARALRELDDCGMARPTTGGVWRGKRATEWRLTFYRCDKTGELPVLNWPHRQPVGKDTKVRVEGHKPHSVCVVGHKRQKTQRW